MRDDKKILCPECGKELGVYILDRVVSSPLGGIPCYHQKVDYRKAAHIGIGKGGLCRTCAKKHFPQGVAYRVSINYVGKRMNLSSGGVNNSGWYATKEEAQAKAVDMNKRSSDNFARVEEHKY